MTLIPYNYVELCGTAYELCGQIHRDSPIYKGKCLIIIFYATMLNALLWKHSYD